MCVEAKYPFACLESYWVYCANPIFLETIQLLVGDVAKSTLAKLGWVNVCLHDVLFTDICRCGHKIQVELQLDS